MKPSKMLELVENLKVGEKVIIEKFKDHLFVEKKKSEVRPFEPKEGDVLYSCVVYETLHLIGKDNKCIATLEIKDNKIEYEDEAIYGDSILANEDQKQLLFDRLKRDGKRWNAETKQLEDLNEPKVGDDVIVWNEPRNQDASITRMTTHSPFIWDMVVRWDGTKEQFDRIRNGGNK